MLILLQIIIADDVGVNDIGAWGAPTISTPNIDQMASEGLKLTQFYSMGSSSCAVCDWGTN